MVGSEIGQNRDIWPEKGQTGNPGLDFVSELNELYSYRPQSITVLRKANFVFNEWAENK